MQIEYNPVTDEMHILIQRDACVMGTERDGSVMLERDAHCNIVGILIYNVSENFFVEEVEFEQIPPTRAEIIEANGIMPLPRVKVPKGYKVCKEIRKGLRNKKKAKVTKVQREKV